MTNHRLYSMWLTHSSAGSKLSARAVLEVKLHPPWVEVTHGFQLVPSSQRLSPPLSALVAAKRPVRSVAGLCGSAGAGEPLLRLRGFRSGARDTLRLPWRPSDAANDWSPFTESPRRQEAPVWLVLFMFCEFWLLLTSFFFLRVNNSRDSFTSCVFLIQLLLSFVHRNPVLFCTLVAIPCVNFN